MDKKLERLAEELHSIWSGWYLYQRDNSTQENIQRREKQSDTRYWDLSEQDKDKDRRIAERILKLLY